MFDGREFCVLVYFVDEIIEVVKVIEFAVLVCEDILFGLLNELLLAWRSSQPF